MIHFLLENNQIIIDTLIQSEQVKLVEDYSCDLQDENGNNKYTLITFEKGYVIYDNQTLSIIEYDLERDDNPYAGYLDEQYDCGWHGVTAYGYKTIDGSGYYRCIDNWGHSTATIKTSTTIGIVYLNQ